MEGYIHSFQSLGTVDGPGVRYVIFLQGCPFRCVYCHNPDTWDINKGKKTEAKDIMQMILRYKSYFGQKGGITVSGGEALLQAEFVAELFGMCHENAINTALDTSGGIPLNKAIEDLLDVTDYCLLDIKMTEPALYKEKTGMEMENVLNFLNELEQRNITTRIRHVVIPGLTDDVENNVRLYNFARKYKCVENIELLPFRKLCIEKYENLHIPFPLADTPEMDSAACDKLQIMLDNMKNES